MKAKLQSLEYLLDRENDLNVGLETQMLRYAGKEVTITAVDSSDDDRVFYIKEDGGDWNWSEDMFASLPKEITLRSLNLDFDIDGNDRVTFEENGAVNVGCQTVPFSTLEMIYKRAAEVRALMPKPKPRKKKKKVSKKR